MLDDLCKGCSVFFSDDGTLNYSHNNCLAWLCNSGKCPHDKQFADYEMSKPLGAVSKDLDLCDAKMSFGDDFGDNATTFHCGLPKGHKGNHRETGSLYGKQPYTITWHDPNQEPLNECLKQAEAVKSHMEFLRNTADKVDPEPKHVRYRHDKYDEIAQILDTLMSEAKASRQVDSNEFFKALEIIKYDYIGGSWVFPPERE